MARLLRDFELDRLSFWLGFLTATLFFWLLRAVRPWISIVAQSVRNRYQIRREEHAASLETHIRNVTLHYAQGYHLASSLFSLDELLLCPRLLAPPPPVEPGKAAPPLDITETTLPYLPDWPEIASAYGAPTLTLIEALQGDVNLVITGPLGSGKSVALAHLASQIARQESLPPQLERRVPLLIHWADLPPSLTTDSVFEPLVQALASLDSSLSSTQLTGFIEETLLQGRIILLLDGMDELSPTPFREITAYLGQLLQRYPGLRLVTTATLDHLDGLIELGFVPMVLLPWDKHQQTEFLNRWGDLWVKFIQPQETKAIHPVLLNTWLAEKKTFQTPLELTLKAWAAYAGDSTGPTFSQALDAYLARMTGDSPDAKKTLELLSVEALKFQKVLFNQREVQDWMVKVENGLLRSHVNSQLRFAHPLIISYLASQSLKVEDIDFSREELRWPILVQALSFSIDHLQKSAVSLQPLLEKAKEPLFQEFWLAARWLSHAPDSPTGVVVMRKLVSVFQNEAYPIGLRARAMVAMAVSGISGVEVLFRKALKAPDANARLLAALACGIIRDTKAVNDLRVLFNDPMPMIMRAACLALVAIGTQPALEAVAEALLHGHEDLRRAAAEAMANDPDQGHPTLQEGSTHGDLLVRRAVAFGLRRVQQSWAIETLEKMQVQDEEWVVKNAATQALEELTQPNPRIPKPILPLTELPWLIAFAGEHGIGVAPGKPAQDVLLMALAHGNEEQRLAALDYINRAPFEAALPVVHQVYQSAKGEVREAALNTLWHFERTGFRINSP